MPVTNYIWDDLSDNVMMETDENGSVTVEYTNEPDLYGAPISQKRGENRNSYFHHDGDGSTRKLTDSNQNVTDSGTYDAYGEVVAESGLFTTYPFRYKGAAGYYTDLETGETYVRARTYDPSIGRWLSQDPLGFIDGINIYREAFVPALFDPTGTRVAPVLCGQCKGKLSVTVAPPELKDLNPHDLVKKIGYHQTVSIVAEFEEPCECCEYRQYKFFENTFVSHIDPQGKETIHPRLTGNSSFDEGVEDCSVINGFKWCYGRKNHPWEVEISKYSKDQCRFDGIDHTGMEDIFPNITKLPPGKLKVWQTIRLLHVIIDVCNNDRIVDSEVTDTFVSGEFTRAQF